MGNTVAQEAVKGQTLRLLKLLAKFPNSGMKCSKRENRFCLEMQNRTIRFDANVLNTAIAQKQVVLVDTRIKILKQGLLSLKLALHPEPSLGLSDRFVGTTETQMQDGRHTVSVNLAESPLSRLRFRKTRDGMSYIAEEEFQAGERLRRDFECGQLQPKISASWGSAIGGKNGAGGIDPAEISDFALDARTRVDKAVEKLGPELAGVALDICCFLKGVELVERERSWPPRSAKLMLKTALSLLARHYGIAGHNNSRSASVQAWGASDFRPRLQPVRLP